ncbi:response regulator [Natronorubrum sp. JWXQ-INN-674]|uniref:Response regulator n=1 Tax=Natronorubrum halalkaliphilum TaxID=2691917 RepID=A0A6B0VJF6_9EURY|nr:response regulator [Natronorubrum halalkaliphilum]MXV61257.1 response regulator [Natronorubrum halalkaliphilum]
MTAPEEQVDRAIDILLVEPNPGDTRLFTENFRDAKLMNTIHAVSDGESALDFVHQRGEYAEKPQPDIILLEPQLPGKSGMDVLSELNGEPALREIPVIVLTSSAVGEEIVRSHDLEADSYIQKPISPDQFVEFIQSVEEFWFAIVRKPTSSATDG